MRLFFLQISGPHGVLIHRASQYPPSVGTALPVDRKGGGSSRAHRKRRAASSLASTTTANDAISLRTRAEQSVGEQEAAVASPLIVFDRRRAGPKASPGRVDSGGSLRGDIGRKFGEFHAGRGQCVIAADGAVRTARARMAPPCSCERPGQPGFVDNDRAVRRRWRTKLRFVLRSKPPRPEAIPRGAPGTGQTPVGFGDKRRTVSRRRSLTGFGYQQRIDKRLGCREPTVGTADAPQSHVVRRSGRWSTRSL